MLETLKSHCAFLSHFLSLVLVCLCRWLPFPAAVLHTNNLGISDPWLHTSSTRGFTAVFVLTVAGLPGALARSHAEPSRRLSVFLSYVAVSLRSASPVASLGHQQTGFLRKHDQNKAHLS